MPVLDGGTMFRVPSFFIRPEQAERTRHVGPGGLPGDLYRPDSRAFCRRAAKAWHRLRSRRLCVGSRLPISGLGALLASSHPLYSSSPPRRQDIALAQLGPSYVARLLRLGNPPRSVLNFLQEEKLAWAACSAQRLCQDNPVVKAPQISSCFRYDQPGLGLCAENGMGLHRPTLSRHSRTLCLSDMPATLSNFIRPSWTRCRLGSLGTTCSAVQIFYRRSIKTLVSSWRTVIKQQLLHLTKHPTR